MLLSDTKDNKKEWYENFGSEYLEKRNTPEEWEKAKREVDFILSKIGKKCSNVLDIQCGFGRHCESFYNKGLDVVGIDISETFLNIAKEKTNKNIKYSKHNVLEKFNFGKFDLAVNLFSSFGYFSDEENKKVAKNISDSLNKDGIFVVDIPNLDYFYADAYKKENKINDCIYKTKYGLFDIKNNTAHYNYVQNSKMKLYSTNDIEAMFKDVGLLLDTKFSNYKNDVIDENTITTVLLFHKG